MDKAGEIESKFYYFPGETAENTKISDRAHALHITAKEWSKITKHLDRNRLIQEALDKEKAHKKALKDGSEAMTKLWPNSIENIRLRKEKEKQEEFERQEVEKGEYYFKLRAEQEKLREEFLQNVKRNMFTASGAPRDLNSALVLSETLYERQKQMEFNEKLQKHEDEVEMQYAAKVKKAAEDEKREKAEERRVDLERRKRFGKLLTEQIEENEATSREQRRRHAEREAIDNIRSQEEQKLIEKVEHEEKITKRNNLLQGIKKELEENRRRQKILEKEDKEMIEATQLYAEAKNRIDCMMKTKEKQFREEAIEEKYKMAMKVAAVNQELGAVEERRLADAIAERDAIEEAKVKEKEEKRQQAIKDRIADREQYLRRLEKEKQRENEIRKWEMLNRIKTSEMMQKYDERSKKEHWQKILEYRKELLEQIADDKELLRQEKELARLMSIVSYDAYDQEFFEYAEEVLALAKKKNRPTYPIEKVVLQYKKDNGLIKKERHCRCCKH